MIERFIDGMDGLARMLNESAALHDVATETTANLASLLVYDRAKKTIGDNTKLAHLAEATQEERVRLGYSADEPLYRDGALLKDSIEVAPAQPVAEGFLAGVGSPEPIFAFHELGYVNARTGEPVPPRPDLKIAMQESAPEIETLLEENLSFSLGFGGRLELKE